MNIDNYKIKIPQFTSLIHKVLTYDVLNNDIVKIYYNKLDEKYKIIKIKETSDEEKEYFFENLTKNISEYCKKILNDIDELILTEEFNYLEYYKFVDKSNYYIFIDYLNTKVIKLNNENNSNKEYLDEINLKSFLLPYFTFFKKFLIENDKLPKTISTIKITKEEYDTLIKANCTVEITKEEYERLKKNLNSNI